MLTLLNFWGSAILVLNFTGISIYLSVSSHVLAMQSISFLCVNVFLCFTDFSTGWSQSTAIRFVAA